MKVCFGDSGEEACGSTTSPRVHMWRTETSRKFDDHSGSLKADYFAAVTTMSLLPEVRNKDLIRILEKTCETMTPKQLKSLVDTMVLALSGVSPRPCRQFGPLQVATFREFLTSWTDL